MRALSFILPFLAVAAMAQKPEVVDYGTLRVGINGRLDGVEKYELRRTGDGYALQSHLEFADRGTAMPLQASLSTSHDFTPRKFRLDGKLDRYTDVATRIQISGRTVSLEERDQISTMRVPSRFFTRTGFRPAALQMMLIRYWEKQGRPSRIALIPAGYAQITKSGTDKVQREGKSIVLDRYRVRVRGEDDASIWLDSQQSLFAAVINAAGVSSMQVVREDLISSLPLFVSSAEAAALDRMREMTAVRPVAAGAVALVGGTLLDLESGVTTRDSVVLVREGKIEYAGGRRKVPSDFKKIDIRGKTVMPGLWDMHAHFEQPIWAPLYLASGVTTVRDVGNKADFEVAIRSAIEKGEARGPRMLLAGIIDGSGPNAVGSVIVSNAEEASAAVESYVRRGFDQIKVYRSITPDELSAITETAHRLGKKVTGHVPNTMSTAEALARGLDMVNHVTTLMRGYLFDIITKEKLSMHRAIAERFDPEADGDALIAEMKRRGTVLDPTLGYNETRSRRPGGPPEQLDPEARRIPPALLDQLLKVGVQSDEEELALKALEKMRRFVGRAHSAGVPIVAGTDGGVLGFALARELELYVRIGMTPLDALRTATVIPARVMDREGELASVKPGAAADLIVIDGNPLKNISDIRRIVRVMTRGVLFDTNDFWKAAEFAPR